MELFEDTPAGSNAHEFTVSEISGAVKRVLEGEFGRVRVRGEIGRVSRPSSGHIYFDLKDDRILQIFQLQNTHHHLQKGKQYLY